MTVTPAPRPVPTTEDRMRDARTDTAFHRLGQQAAAVIQPAASFATYLDRTERNQLDARAACAEQERDEALDARNVLRQQLDTARAELADAQELLAVVDDLAEQLDRARARYATRPDAPLGSAPPRAQEQPPMVPLAGWGGGHSRVPARLAQEDPAVPPPGWAYAGAVWQLQERIRDLLSADLPDDPAGLIDAVAAASRRVDAEQVKLTPDGIGYRP